MWKHWQHWELLTGWYGWSLGLIFLYVYRSAIQGLGNTWIPLVSGIAEFCMRVGVALILPKFIGENGIFYAEICAWSGAAVLLILSYGIIIQKHKNKTDVRYIPMKTAQGYIGQKNFFYINIYFFVSHVP